ncbi:MAG: hypothetical protein MJZ61_08725 [Bacteroidales bacterium]|nr:hypothetical protein [Bacteroidales bacterium]
MKKLLLTLIAVTMAAITLNGQTLYKFTKGDTFEGFIFYEEDSYCNMKLFKTSEFNYDCDSLYKLKPCSKDRIYKESGTLSFCVETFHTQENTTLMLLPYDEGYYIEIEFYHDPQRVEVVMNPHDERTLEFKEIDIATLDEAYMEQYFQKDDSLYNVILQAKARLNSNEKLQKEETTSPKTLYLLGIGATEDKEIGKSVKADMALAHEYFSHLAEQLDVKYQETMLIDNNFDAGKLDSLIETMPDLSNTIMVVLYSGHGFFNYQEDRFPTMILSYEELDNYDIEEILEDEEDEFWDNTEWSTDLFDDIYNLNPAFTLFITDCCNDDFGKANKLAYSLSGIKVEDKEIDITKLKKLFNIPKGVIRLTSAQGEQMAACTENGGLLLPALINNISAQCQAGKKDEPDWSKIVINTCKKIAATTRNQLNEKGDEMEWNQQAQSYMEIPGMIYSLANTKGAPSINFINNDKDDDDGFTTGLISIFIILPLILLILVIIKVRQIQKSHRHPIKKDDN